MDDYVSKPVRRADLHRALSQISEPVDDAEQQTIADLQTETALIKAVIDWDAALEYMAGNEDLLHAVVDATLEEMPKLRSQLSEAIDGQDASETQRIAHTIKGSAAAIAAFQTQAVALTIEEAAIKKDLSSAAQRLPDLSNAIDRLIQNCKEFATGR